MPGANIRDSLTSETKLESLPTRWRMSARPEAAPTASFPLQNSRRFNQEPAKTTYPSSLDTHLYNRRKERDGARPKAGPPRRKPRMSTATVKSLPPEPAYGHLVRLTVQACQVAREAAGAAAEGIATGSPALLNSIRQREKELDKLDMEIDGGVTEAITQVTASEARER